MQLNRSLALLQGQTTVARKVYAILPVGANEDYSPADIARELKSATGAGMDIHIMRGCLARLVESGLIREVVPGRFRRVETKEKVNVSAQRITTLELHNVAPVGAESAAKGEPMELIGGISARLRAEARALMKIADELDAGALAMAERAQKMGEEVATVRQIAALLKGLG
ncbi:hypothetical protein GCM10008164_00970 [Achromobacter xylosoxidans]|nr:hypothetical protein GCM10008164_00970 [Achromobacter xylosoxidans]